jgi:hypothetical protein
MKPAGKIFDREWRLACSVDRVNKRAVDEMIKEHYLGRWPTNVLLTLGLKKRGKILGVATFSLPHNSMQQRFGNQTWELTRLWIDDCVPQNAETFLIGRGIRYIRKEHSDIKTLISFADPEMGHSGIIYRASNWKSEEHESKNLFTYSLK